MNKELHIWLSKIELGESDFPLYITLNETLKALYNNACRVDTTQTHVCSTTWLVKGYRMYVHMLDGETVELKLGQCCGREIKVLYNLEKMLLANVFGLATKDYYE